MPDLPKYHRQITVKPVGKAPLPVSAADVAGGAKGAGLGAIGRGVTDLGNVLAQIKREQVVLNDEINKTKANAYIKTERDRFDVLLTTDMEYQGDGSPSRWDIES